MNKFWYLARQEYRNRVFRRSFILGTLVIPIIITVLLTAIIITAIVSVDRRPIGYVDYSGALDGASMPDIEGEKMQVDILAFPDESSADAALWNEEIQAYYVFPETYLTNPQVDLYFLEEPPDSVIVADFEDYLRYNLLPEHPTPEQLLLVRGFSLTVRSPDGSKEYQDEGAGFFVSIMMPFGMMILMLIVIMGGSGYFLQVVTNEKENRTIEIMITSVTPGQLIGGKSIALVAVGLTQIGIWAASAAAAWFIATRTLTDLQTLKVPWDIFVVSALFFLPTYTIVAGMMIAIGAVVTESQEGQQISGVLSLLFTSPVFFAALAFADPNSPFLIALSFWPTTAMITLLLRWGLTEIPWWQVLLSWSINAGTAMLVVWAASRIFRVGMLRYGQRLSLKAAFQSLVNR
ncbi:MAG TPA: ABC transporter permease [Anaerolineales bacterium]|nr:ABC transporter permease [Anaerolineales bacterium]